MFDIGPGLGNFLLMNTYFHDVATALFAATGLVLWLMLRRYRAETAGGSGQEQEIGAYMVLVYSGMKKLARASLIWIFIGGIPRTLYFKSFEWANAAEHGQVPALIMKHSLAFFFVALGAVLWIRCSAEAMALIEPQAAPIEPQ